MFLCSIKMKQIYNTIIVAIILLTLSSCGKNGLDIDAPDGNVLTIKPSIGETVFYPLESAFSGGGAYKDYYTHRCRFYKEKYQAAPVVNKVEAIVGIYGILDWDVDYTDASQCIEAIVINGLHESLGLGTQLNINMNQGKYEGDSELIKSVQILSYKLPTYDAEGNSNNDSDINIIITTTAGDVITIRFSNTVIPWDGMRG